MAERPPELPAARRRLFLALSGLLGTGLALGAGLGAGELWARSAKPMPRAQIIRAPVDGKGPGRVVTMLHGEPVWSEPGSEARRQEDCPGPDTVDVLLLGSSIFYGTGYEAHQVMSHVLQERLDARAPGRFCVLNHAQPAFTSRGKLAYAKEVVPQVEPEVVIWELWANEAGGFTKLGDDAYNLTGLVVDDAGYPVWLPFMPAALHHALFHRSRFWEWLTLQYTPKADGAYEASWRELVDETLPTLHDLVTDHGGELALLFVPWLDRPFAQSLAEHGSRKRRGYVWSKQWADAAGVPTWDMAREFGDTPPEDVRHDPCCHYNPTGHQRVGEVLDRIVTTLLDDGEGLQDPAPEPAPGEGAGQEDR